MRHFFLDAALFAVLIGIWRWTMDARLPLTIAGAIALLGLVPLPLVSWMGRRSLARNPTPEHAQRIASLVHYSLMLPLGLAIICAIRVGAVWPGWVLPVPESLGLVLTWISGVVLLATVLNLAVRGLGAPFAIALSRRLATDWLYARTRNPMVLACLVFLVALSLRLRSFTLLAWTLLGAAPTWIAILRVYEERELEIRFGESYLAYKQRTPFLWPGLRNRRPVIPCDSNHIEP